MHAVRQTRLVGQPRPAQVGGGHADSRYWCRCRTGLTMEWVNRGTPASDIRLDGCVGLIVNRAYRKFLGIIKGQHWFALRRVRLGGAAAWGQCHAPQRPHTLTAVTRVHACHAAV